MAARTTEEAAELVLAQLDANGWCQGASRDEDGRICLVAAVARATELDTRQKGFTPLWHGFYQKLTRLAAEEIFGTPVTFNDHPDTSEEDVRLLVKRAGTERE